MRASGGGCAGEHYHSARRLLGSGVAAPPAPSLDAGRARLERALLATTAVLFVASVSYVALSTLFACCCCSGRRHRPDPEPAGPPAAAAEETTKRALEEIPVVAVVVHPRDNDPDQGGGRSRDAGFDEECAVCLAEYAGGEEVRVLPACRHGFHRECVDRWLLTRAPTCPVCRAPVVAASSQERHAKGCAPGGAVPLPVVAGT